MNSRDIEIYLERYNNRLKEFGYDAKTLGWGGGKNKQFERFKALTEIGIQEGDSVLDFGCGFADYFEYTQLQGLKIRYSGFDINENLLSIARERHPGIDVRNEDIFKDHLVGQFDWVVCSGVFNAKLSFEENNRHTEVYLTRLFEICNKGVACDFLSTYVDFQHEGANHTDVKFIADIGKKMGARVVIRLDYLPFEFCVYLKK